MKRGRIQIGLILSLLAAGGAISAVGALVGPNGPSKSTGTGVAYAQGEGASSAEAPPSAEAPAATESAPSTESDLTKRVRSLPHGPDVYETHAAQTPQGLRSFETEGIPSFSYAGMDSPVAQTTEKIRELDIAKAAAQKYEIAKEYLSEDRFGRTDPLEITDAVPQELRLLYAGQGDLDALSDAELENLFLSGIRTQLQYVPITIIGVVDNGIQRLVLMEYFGSKLTAQEGQSMGLGRFPIDPQNPRRYMELSLTVMKIQSDFVQLQFNVNYTLLNGQMESLTPVVRKFYTRMKY